MNTANSSRRHMLRALLFGGMGSALAARAGAASHPDLLLLQGNWECVATWKNAERVPNYVGVKSLISDQRLTWFFPRSDGSISRTEATFWIDPSSQPKHFDWRRDDKDPDKVHRRIYHLEGDRLVWADNFGERPTSFEAAAWIFEMRRVPTPAPRG